MIERDAIYIDGAWTPSAGTGVIDVENPATEQIIGRVPEGSPADVDRAVAAAAAAFGSWSATSRTERAEHLRRLHAVLDRRADEIARLIATEMGAPLRIALPVQTQLPLTVLAGYAQLLSEPAEDERIANSLVLKEPIGVVAAITPWNYPLHQIMAKLAPALAAGCTTVLKPSEVAPLVAYLLFEAIDEAGLPPGVANLVCGRGAPVGEALAGHPGVDMVSFTGSTRAGRRVGELAAATVTKLALELGGKSANLILPDADLKAAVKLGVAHAFQNAGQTCNAWTRMLVHREAYDEALDLAVAASATHAPGDPLAPGTRMGPLVSATQRDRVRSYIARGTAEGARLVTGGTEAPEGLERGHYVRPTVFADVDPDSTLAQEEIFGPVLSVIPYTTEDEAVAIANNSRYGLAGAVWSADPDHALAIARRLRTGSVDINGGRYNPLAPAGGYKQSGIGRELGRYGLEEFLQTKSIQI